MNLKIIEHELDDFLSQALRGMGFQREEELFFCKPEAAVVLTLGFSCRSDKGAIEVSYLAGLRYPGIKSLLAPDSDSFDDAIYAGAAIVAPHHAMDKSPTFYEWRIPAEAAVPSIADVILRHVQQYARPFWNQYDTLAKLSDRLSADAQSSCLVLSPEQRICLRATLLALDGRIGEGVKMLEQALLQRAAALPKKRKPLERLLTVLNSRL